MKRKLIEIAREDGRYNAAALKFIYEGLGYTVKNFSEKPQHVSGQTLCEGLRNFAIQKWGSLAFLVLNSWGVKNTRDFGEIVYLMIKNNWLSRSLPTQSTISTTSMTLKPSLRTSSNLLL